MKIVTLTQIYYNIIIFVQQPFIANYFQATFSKNQWVNSSLAYM